MTGGILAAIIPSQLQHQVHQLLTTMEVNMVPTTDVEATPLTARPRETWPSAVTTPAQLMAGGSGAVTGIARRTFLTKQGPRCISQRRPPLRSRIRGPAESDAADCEENERLSNALLWTGVALTRMRISWMCDVHVIPTSIFAVMDWLLSVALRQMCVQRNSNPRC